MMYKKLSLLASNRKLEPLPDNSSGLLQKKRPTSLLSFGTTTETTFPCNTEFQTNILVHRWLTTIDQERFFDLPVMPSLFFLNYFKFSQSMSCLLKVACSATADLSKRWSFLCRRVTSMLSQPRLERTTCLTDILARHSPCKKFRRRPQFVFQLGLNP